VGRGDRGGWVACFGFKQDASSPLSAAAIVVRAADAAAFTQPLFASPVRTFGVMIFAPQDQTKGLRCDMEIEG
jgi:hypothetical protein